MAYPKDIDLINRLCDATQSGELEWKPTAYPERYVAAVKGVYTLLIFRDLERDSFGLTLHDASGREVHTIKSVDVSRVEELFDMARRGALNVDGTIDEILGEL